MTPLPKTKPQPKRLPRPKQRKTGMVDILQCNSWEKFVKFKPDVLTRSTQLHDSIMVAVQLLMRAVEHDRRTYSRMEPRLLARWSQCKSEWFLPRDTSPLHRWYTSSSTGRRGCRLKERNNGYKSRHEFAEICGQEKWKLCHVQNAPMIPSARLPYLKYQGVPSSVELSWLGFALFSNPRILS